MPGRDKAESTAEFYQQEAKVVSRGVYLEPDPIPEHSQLSIKTTHYPPRSYASFIMSKELCHISNPCSFAGQAASSARPEKGLQYRVSTSFLARIQDKGRISLTNHSW